MSVFSVNVANNTCSDTKKTTSGFCNWISPLFFPLTKVASGEEEMDSRLSEGWTAEWSCRRPELCIDKNTGSGATLIALPRPDGVAMLHLLSHYQELIVYLGYCFWRKLLVRVEYCGEFAVLARENLSRKQTKEKSFFDEHDNDQPPLLQSTISARNLPEHLGISGSLATAIRELVPRNLFFQQGGRKGRTDAVRGCACNDRMIGVIPRKVSPKILSPFDERGVGLAENLGQFFCSVIRNNQLDVTWCLLSTVNIDPAERWGPSKRHTVEVAAQAGHVKMAELLLSQGAPVESAVSGSWGSLNTRSPMRSAVKYRHLGVVQVLILAGADVKGINGFGKHFFIKWSTRQRRQPPISRVLKGSLQLFTKTTRQL